MAVCAQCQAANEPDAKYCTNCGKALTFDVPQKTSAPAATAPYRISPSRVLVLGLLSFGLYMFWWYYITWKQYRDSTGSPV